MSDFAELFRRQGASATGYAMGHVYVHVHVYVINGMVEIDCLA